MAHVTSILITVALFLTLSEASKVLVVFPFPARSHNNLGNGFVRHLLKAGHEVTYITPFPLTKPPPNLHQVDVSTNIAAFPEDSVNIDALMKKEVDLNDESVLFFAILKVAVATFDNTNLQKLLDDPKQQFDVVIVEWMFNEIYSGFSAVFNCPYIWSFPYEPYSSVLSLIDEGTNPAYVPTMVSSNVPPFTFTQRAQELWRQIVSVVTKTFYFSKFEREAYNKIFSPILAKKGRLVPAYDEIKYNASLMFGNSHVSLGQPMRLPQNYKIIAGYYIEENVKPLPEDLMSLMNNAKEGVIYFSMGSNLKSKDLADGIKKSLLKMFSELKQTVLWKFEEEFPGLPENVRIIKWAPQQSVLSHPNCILFITHGGLLSTTETMHFGVPIIGIPIFVDQFNNVDRAVQKGFAKRVDISYSLAEDLKQAIKDIVDNPRYGRRAKELSMIYHDRPASPGAELVHWVEHVVRTRGAPHLRSPALHVPWYQKAYLDLAALIVAVILIAKYAIKRLVSLLFSIKTKPIPTSKKSK